MSEDISEKSVTRAAIVHAASGKRRLEDLKHIRSPSIAPASETPADSLRSSSLGSIRCIWRRNHLLVRSGVGVRDLHVDALIAGGGWRDHALILGRRRGFLLASVRPGRVVALRYGVTRAWPHRRARPPRAGQSRSKGRGSSVSRRALRLHRTVAWRFS